MGKLVVALVALAACYSVPANTCLYCTTTCPAGMSCQNGICVEPGKSTSCQLSRVDASGWPCGTKPAAPPSMIHFTGNSGLTDVTFTNIQVKGGQLAVAAPGEVIGYSLHYKITDSACLIGCQTQIEVGFVPGRRLACPADVYIPRGETLEGEATGAVAVPTTPGSYDFRATIGQNFACNAGGVTNWYNGEPDDSYTAARICVN